MTTIDKVKSVLMECLNVDEEQVQPQARLIEDLGAESIDMLDMTFRLEREFDIKIANEELFPHGIFQQDPECLVEGIVTHKGLEALKQAAPHVDLTEFEKNPRFDRISDVFTVASLVRFIERKTASAAA